MPSGRPSVALLLVEHEAVVRAYLTRLARAKAPTDAASLLAAHSGPLQLVMGTMSMHFVTGRELATVLESVHPPVPVIALSSRQWNQARRAGQLAESRALLKVPFDPALVWDRIAALRSDPAAA